VPADGSRETENCPAVPKGDYIPRLKNWMLLWGIPENSLQHRDQPPILTQ